MKMEKLLNYLYSEVVNKTRFVVQGRMKKKLII